mgnify:CR=1 FL=1
MINDYFIYVLLAVTVTAIPGPAIVLTVSNSIKYGYKTAIINIFGNFTAMIILASLSAAGLGAVILASSTLFTIIKLAGCLYLVYLGIKAWRSPPLSTDSLEKTKSGTRKKVLDIYKEGFGVGISNPKAIAFFTALFPQFVDQSRPFIPQFLTLILTIEAISIIVMTTYAVSASLASPFLSRKKPLAFFNRLTGITFIGYGLGLLLDE